MLILCINFLIILRNVNILKQNKKNTSSVKSDNLSILFSVAPQCLGKFHA